MGSLLLLLLGWRQFRSVAGSSHSSPGYWCHGPVGSVQSLAVHWLLLCVWLLRNWWVEGLNILGLAVAAEPGVVVAGEAVAVFAVAVVAAVSAEADAELLPWV